MPRPIGHPKLFKRGGTFYIAYHDGERVRKVSTRTAVYETALNALAEFLKDLNAPPQGGVSRDVAWCCQYYADAKSTPLENIYHLKPILKELGGLPAESVTKAICRNYTARRTKQTYTKNGWEIKKPIKSSTVRRELSSLRAATRLCKDEGQIPDAGSYELPDDSPPKENFLTEYEAQKLIDAAPPHLRLYILLGLGTGARNGALVGAKWSDVTFIVNNEFGQIDFRRFDVSRNRKRRGVVPLLMGTPLYNALIKAKEEALTDYVIEYKGKPIAVPRKGIITASKRAGIQRTNPHMLKHTAITRMLTKGVPVADVSEFTQTSVETIMKTYGHWISERGEGVARAAQSF